MTERTETQITPTLKLINDDYPAKPDGIMLQTYYVGTAQLVLTREDWSALTDLAVDAYKQAPEAYEAWRKSRGA